MNAFRMTPDEIQRWERDGYFVRENVFSDAENDHLRQVAEDIVAGKRRMPMAHIDRNCLGSNAQDPSPQLLHTGVPCGIRDDPLVDILGPDILGINNLFIWKAPEIARQNYWPAIRDEDGVAVEVTPGAVIWFHSHLLHKSTNNHSQRFRRSLECA